MASAEFQFDTRIRRYHVPLKTQQRRLRHLRSVSARNVVFNSTGDSVPTGLYYTLHQTPNSNAFYTSEVIADSLNPSWKEFEPSNFPESTALSLPYFTIKMWNSSGKLIIEWVIFFSGLDFIGKQIPKEGKNFKSNSLVFGMLEGYYGCLDCDEETASSNSHKNTITADVGSLQTSCAFSTLGRIRMVESVIGQIQSSSSNLKQNIELKLQKTEKMHKIHSARELLKIKVSMLEVEVRRQNYYLSKMEKQLETNQQDLSRHKQNLIAVCEDLQKTKDQLMERWSNFWEYRGNLLKIEAQLVHRRKQLISDLCSIYPIVQFPDHKGFSIHNVHLPNSEKLIGHDDVMMSVALGYVSHVILMVSQFLNVPLRYELHFHGSKSTILDLISSSIPVKNREFPLYSKGKDKRFFEYAVYLLNKNIAQLRTLFGLTSKDLSATLPNLHGLIQQRLSFTNESGSLAMNISDTKLWEESTQSSTLVQNGLSHVSSTSSSNDIPHKLLENSNSEMELLRREMAAMLPNSDNHNNSVIPVWSKDINSTFRGSLDKGLNDMKVLENTQDVLLSKHLENLPMKLIGQALHHSSYPNLSDTVQRRDELPRPISGSPQLPPLKTWTSGSSQTNSEEETIEESSLSSGDTTKKRKGTCFYVPQEWTANDTKPVSSNADKILESVILADPDFGEELTQRTEQLANRSSSFQMQKVNSLNSDSMTLHPS